MSIIDASRPILVYLANGVQGGAVVQAAVHRGVKIRALVRNPAHFQAEGLPGVEVAIGDLDDPEALRAAHAGVDHAILQIPTGPASDMRRQTGNALAAAGQLRSLVLKSASASRAEPCDEPSFVANAMIEAMVRDSAIPWVIVRPTMYLDNLLKPSARAEIANDGVFNPPIKASQRIAWTSAEDCAEAALTLLSAGAYGGDHRIAGPESVTGSELAARISAGLNRTVVYRAQSIDAFEADVDQAMGSGAGRLVASKFRFFETHEAEADEILAGAFSPQPGLDGFRPKPIEDWVHRHRRAFLR